MHEVAHDHRAAIHALEGEPAAERERRLDGDAVEGDVQVAARQCVFVHVAGLVGAGFAERLIHLVVSSMSAASAGLAAESEPAMTAAYAARMIRILCETDERRGFRAGPGH